MSVLTNLALVATAGAVAAVGQAVKQNRQQRVLSGGGRIPNTFEPTDP